MNERRPTLAEEIIADLLNCEPEADDAAELFLRQRGWTENSIDGHWQKEGWQL